MSALASRHRMLLVVVVAIAGVVLRVGTARAALAPMCDQGAMTVPAPLPLKPVRGGEIVALDCARFEVDLDVNGTGGDSVEQALERACEKVAPGGLPWPPCPRGERTRVAPKPDVPALPRIAFRVYRPPRV
jgi:hypothetical protein